MTTPNRRPGGHTQHTGEAPSLQPDALLRTTADLHRLTELATIGLKGNEPEDGLDFLFDAFELLKRDLAPLRVLRRRVDLAVLVMSAASAAVAA